MNLEVVDVWVFLCMNVVLIFGWNFVELRGVWWFCVLVCFEEGVGDVEVEV